MLAVPRRSALPSRGRSYIPVIPACDTEGLNPAGGGSGADRGELGLVQTLTRLVFWRPFVIGLGLEQEDDQEQEARQDGVHPENPAPVGVGIGDQAGKDAAERGADGEHQRVEADPRTPLVDEVQVTHDRGA